tara:strand:+ start:47 stop:535 length:489 start_codon:yes stop_codon:yes gene_type:complete
MTIEAIGEQAAVFKYGFLSIKTSKLLSEIIDNQIKEISNEEDNETIQNAEEFLSNIINGQSFIAREEGNLKPTLESIEAVDYALNTLNELQENKAIEKIKDLSEINQFFRKIHTVLSEISKNKIDQISHVNLKLSKNFFSNVSNKLLSEAQEMAKLYPQTTF